MYTYVCLYIHTQKGGGEVQERLSSAGGWEKESRHRTEEEQDRSGWVNRTQYPTHVIETSGRRHLAGGGQCHLEPGLLMVSWTTEDYLYTFACFA